MISLMNSRGSRRSQGFDPVVSFRNVGLGYEDPRKGLFFNAVFDVSFEVGFNELVCVVGPSGCGKSTILIGLAGLLPCSAGTITVNGGVVKGPGPDRAVVFQRPALLPWRTVVDNAAYGLRLRGATKADARERAVAMLELVGLSDVTGLYPYQLSGGMQQRVNLARALATDPAIVLLDEPFSSLDAQQREVLQGELLQIWESTDKSGIFVTHQIDEAVLLGDRVVVLTRGPAATVKMIVEIDLPRPRGRETRGLADFAKYVEQIWASLEISVADR